MEMKIEFGEEYDSKGNPKQVEFCYKGKYNENIKHVIELLTKHERD